jgi:hypothetical protein
VRRRAMYDVSLTLGVCISRISIFFSFSFLHMDLSVCVDLERGIERARHRKREREKERERKRERSIVRLIWASLIGKKRKRETVECVLEVV